MMRKEVSFVERVDPENSKDGESCNEKERDIESGLDTEIVEDDVPRKRFSSLVSEENKPKKQQAKHNSNGRADADARNKRKTRIHSALVRLKIVLLEIFYILLHRRSSTSLFSHNQFHFGRYDRTKKLFRKVMLHESNGIFFIFSLATKQLNKGNRSGRKILTTVNEAKY
jgi:hypothetical protein